jgi:mono/diheme cytochrome c family protein
MNSNVKRIGLAGLALAVLMLGLSAWQDPLTIAYAQDGKALYAKKCMNCHAADGSGNTAKGKEYKLKDIRSPEVQKMTDQQLFDYYFKGKGKMTGLGKTLSKEELQALVAYTRELAKKK